MMQENLPLEAQFPPVFEDNHLENETADQINEETQVIPQVEEGSGIVEPDVPQEFPVPDIESVQQPPQQG